MISQEKLNSIHRLELPEVVQILDECIEALGLTDIETARQALGVNRSRVYQLMNDKTSYKIGKHKFLMINTL